MGMINNMQVLLLYVKNITQNGMGYKIQTNLGLNHEKINEILGSKPHTQLKNLKY